MSNIDRADALSTWDGFEKPPGRDDVDQRRFSDVLLIFIRTWPHLRPLVMGYWREKVLRAANGAQRKTTDWSFYHAPPIVTLVMLMGPLTGLLPYGEDFKLDLLLYATFAMTVLSWMLLFLKGQSQVYASIVLIVIGIVANATAVLGVTGYGDNLQVGLVTLACLGIWMVQYRYEQGALKVRLRLGAHLVYYYGIVWMFVFLNLLAALFSADVINQSILVGEPLTEFVSDLIGREDMAEGSVPKKAEPELKTTGQAPPGGRAGARTQGRSALPPGRGSRGESAVRSRPPDDTATRATAAGADDDLQETVEADAGDRPLARPRTGQLAVAGRGARSEPIGRGRGGGRPVRTEADSDLLLTDEQRKDLVWYFILFNIALFVIALPGILLSYYKTWIMQGINQGLRSSLIERWHRLSMRYHGDHRVGDSVYRVYQDSAQVTNVIDTVVSMTQTLIMYFMGLVFLTALDPILGGLGVTVAVAAIFYARWFSPRLRARSLVARETNAAVTSRIQEVFSAIRVVKAAGMEDLEQHRFEQDSVVAFNAAFRLRSLIALVTVVMFTISATFLLVGEFFMGIWASMGRETFAAVLIGLVGLSFVRWNLAAYEWGTRELAGTANLVIGGGRGGGILRQWATVQDMAMGLNRVFDILDIEPDVQNVPDARPLSGLTEGVRFDNVTFGYDADEPVLRNVSFTAAPGSVTAIVGPTGCGKSTLMSLLPRIYDPDAGSVMIDGLDLRQYDVDSLRQNVSIALQENVLFAMSLRDNIRYVVPDADDERVRHAAHVACVDEYIDSLPQGLDTMLSDRGGRLSTGQRQRLSIARAIVKDAPILILDEPTAALDADTELRVLDRLAAWAMDRAVFLITHRISTISRADQILYLDDGEIIERGSHNELMQIDGGRYRHFVETESALSQRDEAGDGNND